MPKAEVLKRLLDEFDAQQQQNQEELNSIEQDIQQLEAKIEDCRQQAQLVDQDREKVLAMMGRYGQSQDTADKPPITEKPVAASSPKSKLQPASKATETSTAQNKALANKPSAAKQVATANLKPTPSPKIALPPRQPPMPLEAVTSPNLAAASAQTQKPEPATESPAPTDGSTSVETAPTEDPPAQGDNDTVKSINEALRGLFR